MKPLNIVFAGTPEFTIPALDALHASPHRLIAVYSQPDRPKGRGRKLIPTPSKAWAEAHNISVFQPVNFKDEAAVAELRALKPDVMVVVAYGLILKREVLDIPKFGCINIHPSLLPAWRGASPIQSTLLHGDTKTGVCIMQMDEGMDTGPVLDIAHYDIPEHTTSQMLHDTLAELATHPLLKVLDKIAASEPLNPQKQDDAKASYAKKILKQDALIDWSCAAKTIEHQVCAFNPWPIASTQSHGETIRIHRGYAKSDEKTEKAPGTLLEISKQGISVATGEGCFMITQLQLPGGKALHVSDWLCGNTKALDVGHMLG